MKELLSNVGSGGGAPATGAPAAAGGAAPSAEVPAEEKKEEEKEESDEDMVCFYSISSMPVKHLCMHMLFPTGLWSLRLIYRKLFLLASSSPCISHRAVFPFA